MNELAALLSAVHANPDDIATRLVYADALGEVGDPRGEFIVMQCARGSDPPSPRERELLETHGTAWLGRLAPILDPAFTVFERGFLHTARVANVRRPQLLAMAGYPTWATVAKLSFHDRAGGIVVKHGPVVRGPRVPAAKILLDPIMRGLREVSGIDGDVLVTLCREGADLPIQSVIARTYPLLERDEDLPDRNVAANVVARIARDSNPWRVEPTAQVELEAARGLPALRHLTLHTYPCDRPDFRWLFASPLARRLASVRLENLGGTIDLWLAMIHGAPPTLREIAFEHWDVTLIVHAVDDALDLEISAKSQQRSSITAALARVPPGRVRHVRFTTP